jgi:hypothetical protein
MYRQVQGRRLLAAVPTNNSQSISSTDAGIIDVIPFDIQMNIVSCRVG